MKITFDPVKRAAALRDRELDFAHAAEVFAGRILSRDDDRKDYGETRIVTVGYLRSRMVIVVWTQRGDARHIISMRKANDREKARYTQRLEETR
jgi:uncharacterized DUF497 family protein